MDEICSVVKLTFTQIGVLKANYLEYKVEYDLGPSEDSEGERKASGSAARLHRDGPIPMAAHRLTEIGVTRDCSRAAMGEHLAKGALRPPSAPAPWEHWARAPRFNRACVLLPATAPEDAPENPAPWRKSPTSVSTIGLGGHVGQRPRGPDLCVMWVRRLPESGQGNSPRLLLLR